MVHQTKKIGKKTKSTTPNDLKLATKLKANVAVIEPHESKIPIDYEALNKDFVRNIKTLGLNDLGILNVSHLCNLQKLEKLITNGHVHIIQPSSKGKYSRVLGVQKDMEDCQYLDVDNLRIFFFHKQKNTNWIFQNIDCYAVMISRLSNEKIIKLICEFDRTTATNNQPVNPRQVIIELIKDGASIDQLYKLIREETGTIFELANNISAYERVVELEDRFRRNN